MLEFRILGPIEVVRDGRPLPLGGAKQRALVADLALHANEVLSADRLIDDLWGEEPPETASHLIHVYVSRLRKTFEDDGRGVLVTRTPGYVLKLEPPDELDAERFEVDTRRGVELLDARPAEALEALDHALAAWRGRALEEFADEAFAQPSIARLDEMHQVTFERRVEALLALGKGEDALVELEGLIARFPLRERLRELQMLALYRSGRQADALQAYQAARRTLADELGVDPGTGLVSLEQAILRHDPELAGPAPARPAEEVRVAEPQGAGSGGAVPSEPRRRKGAVVAAGIVLAASAVGLAAYLVLHGSAPTEHPSATPRVSASPDTGVAPPSLEWVEVPDPGGAVFGGPGDQVLLGGAVTPRGTLAVGYSASRRSPTDRSRDYDAAAWFSQGQQGWVEVSDAAFIAPGNQEATDAVTIPDRTVVVGSDASGGDHDAAVWTLEGTSGVWGRVRVDAPGIDEPGDQWVRGVTWTGTRVLAVGLSRLHGDTDAAIWTSEDGLDWTLLRPTNLGVPGQQQMSTVTMLGDLIVAAGSTAPVDDRDAAVWVSTDGFAWEPIAADALGGEGDQQINALIAGGPGLIAVGQETADGDEDAAVWVSTDGRAWIRIMDPGDALGGPGSQQLSAVASSEGLIVAAGTETLDREKNGAVWLSADGMSWSRQSPTAPGMSTLSDFGRQGIRELLVVDGAVVALGWEGRGTDDDADAWLGHPTGL